MNFISYPDREFLMLELAGRITSQLSEELRIYGKASLSVPGGTTPGPIFDILSGVQLDWANVAVLLNDERWVGEDNPRSNTRLLKERLLVDKAAAATLVPLYAKASAPPVLNAAAKVCAGTEVVYAAYCGALLLFRPCALAVSP